MKKKVLKFGGTSVGSIQRIVHAAKIIKREYDSGNKILVVVSAMAGTTNNLVAHSVSISKKFCPKKSFIMSGFNFCDSIFDVPRTVFLP